MLESWAAYKREKSYLVVQGIKGVVVQVVKCIHMKPYNYNHIFPALTLHIVHLEFPIFLSLPSPKLNIWNEIINNIDKLYKKL